MAKKRPRGRPPKIVDPTAPRTYAVLVRHLSEEEKALIEAAAKQDERPTSIWARRILIDAAKRELKKPTEPPPSS